MFILQSMDFGGDGVGGGLWGEGAAFLKDNDAFVVVFVDKMVGDACFGFFGSLNRLVNRCAIHNPIPNMDYA